MRCGGHRSWSHRRPSRRSIGPFQRSHAAALAVNDRGRTPAATRTIITRGERATTAATPAATTTVAVRCPASSPPTGGQHGPVPEPGRDRVRPPDWPATASGLPSSKGAPSWSASPSSTPGVVADGAITHRPHRWSGGRGTGGLAWSGHPDDPQAGGRSSGPRLTSSQTWASGHHCHRLQIARRGFPRRASRRTGVTSSAAKPVAARKAAITSTAGRALPDTSADRPSRCLPAAVMSQSSTTATTSPVSSCSTSTARSPARCGKRCSLSDTCFQS